MYGRARRCKISQEDMDMITATLLNNMGTEHALNALRAELPDDLMWLVDWVERLQPSDDECAIL